MSTSGASLLLHGFTSLSLVRISRSLTATISLKAEIAMQMPTPLRTAYLHFRPGALEANECKIMMIHPCTHLPTHTLRTRSLVIYILTRLLLPLTPSPTRCTRRQQKVDCTSQWCRTPTTGGKSASQHSCVKPRGRRCRWTSRWCRLAQRAAPSVYSMLFFRPRAHGPP